MYIWTSFIVECKIYPAVKNNNDLRASGDKHANDIFKEYNGMAMAAYEYLGDGPINNIVTYLVNR